MSDVGDVMFTLIVLVAGLLTAGAQAIISDQGARGNWLLAATAAGLVLVLQLASLLLGGLVPEFDTI